MIKEYIKENQDRILEELFSLIRIPSVSAQPDKHGADMVRCAERWKELLLMAGVDRAEVMPTDGKENAEENIEKQLNDKYKQMNPYGF